MKKLLVFTVMFFLLISCGTDEKKTENDSDISSDISIVNDEDNTLDEDVAEESEDEADEDADLSESTPDPDLVQNDEDDDDADEEPDDEFVFEVETCEDLNFCLNICDGNEECEKCTSGVDSQIIEDYNSFNKCLDNNCSGKTAVAFSRCMNRYCHCEAYFCFDTNACYCNCMPDPYGFVDIDAEFNYAYINEEFETDDEYKKKTPFAVGKVSNDLIDDFRYSTGTESFLHAYEGRYLALVQETTFDVADEALDLEDAVMSAFLYFTKEISPGVKSVDYYSSDGVSLFIFGKEFCVHAVGKGEVTIIDGQYGEHENGYLKVKGTDIRVYSPHYAPVFGNDIKGDLESMGLEICDFLDSCWRHYQCERP